MTKIVSVRELKPLDLRPIVDLRVAVLKASVDKGLTSARNGTSRKFPDYCRNLEQAN